MNNLTTGETIGAALALFALLVLLGRRLWLWDKHVRETLRAVEPTSFGVPGAPYERLRARARELEEVDELERNDRAAVREALRADDENSLPPTSLRCLDCRFFEVEAAQDAMRRNPAFARVMAFMSPHQSGKRVVTKEVPCPTCMPGSEPGVGEPCETCSGSRVIQKSVNEYPSGVPMNAKWTDYGWCTNEHVVLENDVPMNERVLWGGMSHCEGRFYHLRLKTRTEREYEQDRRS